VDDTLTRFRISPDVVARDISDGLMLVNVQTGAAFKLNWVGAAIWKRLDGKSTIDVIVAGLGTLYQVGAETLRRDVTSLLEELERQGLVGRTGSP
jgi:Coenzyme PQQ synthesis protein D (PqqD)